MLTLTRTGVQRAPVGTPHYMSLEQHTSQPIDFRTDIWSLGIVMHRCLSGEYPFGNDAANFQLVLLAIATAPAPPPLPNISDQLATIITKALQKNACDRFQTATEMLAAGGLPSLASFLAPPTHPDLRRAPKKTSQH